MQFSYSHDTYSAVHQKILSLIKENEIKFKGTYTYIGFADLDVLILKLFDCLDKAAVFPPRLLARDDNSVYHSILTAAANQLETAMQHGTKDLRWLYGPHAVTVLKAKLAAFEESK